MKRINLAIGFCVLQGWGLPSLAVEVAQNDQTFFVSTDRYSQSSIKPRADQLSPLDTLVSFAFGDEVKTVGTAVREMLDGSGYVWSAPLGEVDDNRLNGLPLPVINRDIGPVRLRDGLSTLAGVAWQLHVDELSRKVWFAIKNPQTTTTTITEKSRKSRCFWRRC
jgi:conjugative transfer region protein (TIGR03748 family)